jgi:hypothetical protein
MAATCVDHARLHRKAASCDSDSIVPKLLPLNTSEETQMDRTDGSTEPRGHAMRLAVQAALQCLPALVQVAAVTAAPPSLPVALAGMKDVPFDNFVPLAVAVLAVVLVVGATMVTLALISFRMAARPEMASWSLLGWTRRDSTSEPERAQELSIDGCHERRAGSF